MADNFPLANDSFLVLSLVVYFVVDYHTFKMVVSQAQSKGLAPICHDKHSTIVSTHIGNTKANKAFYRVKMQYPTNAFYGASVGQYVYKSIIRLCSLISRLAIHGLICFFFVKTIVPLPSPRLYIQWSPVHRTYSYPLRLPCLVISRQVYCRIFAMIEPISSRF